jgi:hypothetical protein
MRDTSSAVWQVWCTVFLLNRKFEYFTASIIPDCFYRKIKNLTQ